jgi:hypothetical protein
MGTRRFDVVEAKLKHVASLQGRLRRSDLQEIEASSGRDPDAALLRSWKLSEMRHAFLLNGEVIAVFGCSRLSMLSDTGSPWLLGSEELNRVGIEVGKRSRQYIMEMRKRFGLLENYIDARQKISLRWLKWCAFEIDAAKPYGVLGLNFHRFWMI